MWVFACLPHERDLDREPPATLSDKSREEDETETGKGDKDDDPEQVKSPAAKAPRVTAAERKLAAMTAKAKTDPVLDAPFEDAFERPAVGNDWRITGPGWRIADGQLCAERARNHPAWLARKLPENALIEFDALSHSSDGDLKVEVFGDGARFAAGTSYTDATSYVLIFGGWKNRLHVLARLDEHSPDRKAVELSREGASLRERTVEPGKTYRFRIERRDGKTLSWSVDGEKIHELADAEPLAGAGHDHFGFNDWEARVCFDNLRVTPL